MFGKRAVTVALTCVCTALILTSVVKAENTDKEAKQSKEKKLTKEQIPSAVVTAFQKAYPKAVIKGVGEEKKDSVTYIEIESVDGKVNRDLQYTTDGKVVEIEETIDAKTLPQAAQTQIGKDYPKGNVEHAERVIRGNQVQYEVSVDMGEHRYEIVFDAAGKVLNTKDVSQADEED